MKDGVFECVSECSLFEGQKGNRVAVSDWPEICTKPSLARLTGSGRMSASDVEVLDSSFVWLGTALRTESTCSQRFKDF